MTDKSTEVVAAPKPALTTGRGLGAIIPQDVDQAYRLANIIATADMAPKSYGRDANKIMVAIMHGMEVGLTPLAALQSIAVINGSPAIWGDGALALVQGSGLLADIAESIEGEGDARFAECSARRVGRDTPIVRTFSVADAKKAGLWGKSGPWQTYPERMMQMRARSWTLRDGFADVLRGLGVVEERQDMPVRPGDKAVNITPPPPPPVRAQFKPMAPEAKAATVDPETGEVTEPDALDEIFRATMRDEVRPGAQAVRTQAAEPQTPQSRDVPGQEIGGKPDPTTRAVAAQMNAEANDEVSGSAAAVSSPARRVGVSSTDDAGSSASPGQNKIRWVAKNGQVVEFKDAGKAKAIDLMMATVLRGIAQATPDEATAARKRNEAIIEELRAAYPAQMLALSNALAEKEGA